MKALNLLITLRDDYIHGELDCDVNESIKELENLQNRKCENCKYNKEQDNYVKFYEELMISDELLCEILRCDVVKIEIKDNTLEYDCDFCDVVIARNISIDEFVFECKKWLLKNNIAFTLNYYNDNLVQFYCEKYHLDIESSSEIETIIKACNWILKSK